MSLEDSQPFSKAVWRLLSRLYTRDGGSHRRHLNHERRGLANAKAYLNFRTSARLATPGGRRFGQYAGNRSTIFGCPALAAIVEQ
jgi:hypothetical protein